MLGLAAVIRRLPEGAIPPAGHLLGVFAHVTAREARGRASRNLAMVCRDWPPHRRALIVKGMFLHLGLSLVEAVRLSTSARVSATACAPVRGLDILDQAYRRGRGVVAATGHLGNWEVLAACFADLGYPVHVVARRHPNPRLNEFIVSLREGYGVRVLDRDRDTRAMVRALRRGEIVALLVDQDTKVQSEVLPFLGLPARTPVGHARLAVHTGAALIVLTIRRDSGRHVVTVWEEVLAPASLPEDERVRLMALRCNEILGNAILEAPEQWVWLHRRWREALPQAS